jgi:hypothetical protein
MDRAVHTGIMQQNRSTVMGNFNERWPNHEGEIL